MAEGGQPAQPQMLREEPIRKKSAVKRKAHRKSRTGCTECRRSRVKCDEAKPSCSFCLHRFVECSFLSIPPGPVPAISGLRQTSSPGEITPGAGSPFSNSGSVILCTNLHMEDLELLIQYTSFTAHSIPVQHPTHSPIWLADIPKLALEHPFLIHGILAIAALHLSHLNLDRQQEFAILAAKHENIALPLFRAEASDITERNCAAIFAFAVLVVFYAMASPNQPNSMISPGTGSSDGLPNWWHLLRGVKTITSTKRDLFEKSPLAPLLDTHQFDQRISNPSDEVALNSLSLLFAVPANCLPERLEEIETYREALSSLHYSYSSPEIPSLSAQPLPYVWFLLISDKYLQFLSQRRPEAMVLLAYACVILKRAEPCWFMDGLAERVMRPVLENIGPEWRVWIEWPLQELGFK